MTTTSSWRGPVAEFEALLQNADASPAAAVIQVLGVVIKNSSANTVMELVTDLKAATASLVAARPRLTLSVESGSELFMRFVMMSGSDQASEGEFQQCKLRLVERGEAFMGQALRARTRIGRLAMNFVKDGAVVLVHSFSRAVVATLSLAAKQGRAFSVLATESLPDGSGREVAAAMNAVGVPVTLIRDAAVGSMMPKVDLVMVGAEGVLESGGIVNKVGTYTVSLCAKALNKPLYVITESFKFTRQFPLSQADVQGEAVSDARHFEGQGFKELADKGVLFRSPLVDYTPPSNITLLCTDLGVFTPSAVSDELIKLYFS